MKKMLFATAALACMAAIGAERVHAQQVGIDSAIWSAAAGLSVNVDGRANVAVVAMQADSARMSDYLINEMINALIGLQGGAGFTTLGRAQFDLLMGGLRFDTAGWVDGTTAQAIGRLMDVQYVITGTFEPLAGFLRFRAQVIDVETAAIRGMHTVDVQNDDLVAYLMRPDARVAPAHAAAARAPTTGGFTVGQRWGTYWLNWLVPGLGSFVIMRDTFGGVFQMICGLGGYALFIVGVVGRWEGYSSHHWGGHVSWHEEWRLNTAPFVIGLVMMTTQFVFNIVRSAGFMRNAPPRAAAALSPDAWNLAIDPGKHGIEAVSLSRVFRF